MGARGGGGVTGEGGRAVRGPLSFFSDGGVRRPGPGDLASHRRKGTEKKFRGMGGSCGPNHNQIINLKEIVRRQETPKAEGGPRDFKGLPEILLGRFENPNRRVKLRGRGTPAKLVVSSPPSFRPSERKFKRLKGGKGLGIPGTARAH